MKLRFFCTSNKFKNTLWSLHNNAKLNYEWSCTFSLLVVSVCDWFYSLHNFILIWLKFYDAFKRNSLSRFFFKEINSKIISYCSKKFFNKILFLSLMRKQLVKYVPQKNNLFDQMWIFPFTYNARVAIKKSWMKNSINCILFTHNLTFQWNHDEFNSEDYTFLMLERLNKRILDWLW